MLGRDGNLHQPLLDKPPRALRSFLAAGKERIQDELEEGSLELDFLWQHMWPPCCHPSACPVGVILGLKFYLQARLPWAEAQLLTLKRDAQAPSTVDRRRKAFLKGAKMQLQLCQIGFVEEAELFPSARTPLLGQSGVSRTSLSSGALTSVCPRLSTTTTLPSSDPSPSFPGRSLHAAAGLQARLRAGARHALGPHLAHREFPAPPLRLPAVCLLQR